MLCHLCKNPIPENRGEPFTKKRVIYCSDLCNKRAWHLRHNNPKESIFNGTPQKGVAWEEWFIKRFGAIRPSRSLNTPFDFLWNGEKIDLKIGELYKRKFQRGKPIKNTIGWWVFNRNGSDCDFMICIGLISGKVNKVFKIPESSFPKSGATISPLKSKYDQYLIKL